MMKFNKIPALFLLLAGIVLLCGSSCGYHMGSMMHPQIRSIAVAEIKNDTPEPLLTALARQEISASFQTDNSLTLKSPEQADCLLYCRIISVKNRGIRYDSQLDDDDYIPAEFLITVEAEFTVLIPGRSEPLIRKRTVSGSAHYQYNADPQVGKYYGMRQACYQMARKMVEYTTEAW